MATILVVDDNADNRFVLSQMLMLNGYVVQCAINGRDALERTKALLPDLILMDMAMPEMDGWTAARLMKQDALLAHIPVVAVTGHVTYDEIDRALSAGCIDHLEKPIDYERMIAKVRALLAPKGVSLLSQAVSA